MLINVDSILIEIFKIECFVAKKKENINRVRRNTKNQTSIKIERNVAINE